jgi:transposase
LDKIAPEDCVYLDEMGCGLNANLEYGRSPAGERVYDENPTSPGMRMSTVAVLTKNGIEADFSYTGSMTAKLFVLYLEVYLLNLLAGGKVLIMDNLRVHHATVVMEFLEKHKIRFLFLPPYSPELNPIEEAFSKMKHGIRKQKSRAPEVLYKTIKNSIKTITEDDAISYINHSYEFI